MPRKIIVLIGAPGTGKGTLATDLVAKHQFAHFSTGEIFRDNMKRGTELGKQVTAIMESGGLCPDELTAALVEDAIDSTSKDTILDGFPRTLKQVELLDAALRYRTDHSEGISFELIPIVLSYTNEDVLVHRITQIRANAENRKEDSDVDNVRKRIRVYKEQTAPLIHAYQMSAGVDHIFSEQDRTVVLSKAEEILKLK